MSGAGGSSSPRLSLEWCLFIACILTAIASKSSASTPSPTETPDVDNGNRLLDNGTVIFGTGGDEGVMYLLGDEDYRWKSIGSLAAEWVREGVLRSVPPHKVITLFKDYFMADSPELVETGKKVLMVEMPVIITSFMLIAMAVIIPVVGLFFCCCRCAGKCGGTRRQEDVASLSKCWAAVLYLVLIAVCTFIVISSYMTKPSVDRMVDTVDHARTVAQNMLQDVDAFKDDFIEDLRRLGVDDLTFVLNAVDSQLNDIGIEVSGPFLEESEPYLSHMSAAIDNLRQELTSLTSTGSALDLVINTTARLVSSGQSLQDALTAAKDNLTAIRDECLADTDRVTAGACDVIPDPDQLDGGDVDFSTLTIDDLNLSDLGDEMQTSIATIQDLLATGNATLQNTPELIWNTSEPTMKDVSDAINVLQSSVVDLVDDTTDSLNEMFDAINIESLEELIERSVQIPVEDNIITTVTSVLPLVCAFMVVFTVIGLLLAPCGSSCQQGRTDKGCPSDCGGKMMMGSACWSFSVSILICLLGAIFLIIGSTLTIVCDSLIDLSVIREIVDDPDMWGGNHVTSRLAFGNSTFNLTVYQILEDCKEDKTMYDAFNLQSTGLLDIVLDLNIREMIPEMSDVYESVNDSVSSLDVMPSNESDSLLAELTDQLSPNNISQTVAELQDGLGQIDLKNVSDSLYDGADDVDGAYPAMATDLRDLADDIISIEITMTKTINLTNDLLSEVIRLNASLQNVQVESEIVSASVTDLSDFIKFDAGSLIIESLDSFMENILALADQFTVEVMRRIEQDMGKCAIIRNIYDALVGAVCLFFLPGLNVFWFALAAISFALVPNIVFNVRLAKYLRNPTNTASSGANAAERGGGPSTSDGTRTSGNLISRVSNSFVQIRIPKNMAGRFNKGD